MIDVCVLGSFDLSFDFSFEVGYPCDTCIIIKDKFGNPVQGALLTSSLNSKIKDNATTDFNGKAYLLISPEKYNQVSVNIIGFQNTTITIQPFQDGSCKEYVINYCIESSELPGLGFFTFEEVAFCSPLINSCTDICKSIDCENTSETYILPSIVLDNFTFIVNPTDIGLDQDYLLDNKLKVGIYRDSVFVQSIGYCTQPAYPSSKQIIVHIEIPDIDLGVYQIGFALYQDALNGIVNFTNTTLGECDGSIIITPENLDNYYSIDNGLTFKKNGRFENLCNGLYSVLVIDSYCAEFRQDVEIKENLDCSQFAGSNTNDLLGYKTNDFINCNTNNFI